MFKTILVLAVMVLAGLRAECQIQLSAGEVYGLSYRLEPAGLPCTATPERYANSASVSMTLHASSLQRGNAFRIEILDRATSQPVSSWVWSGPDSPLTLSTSGFFTPGGVRFTGLTGSVAITSVTLPWSQSELSVVQPRHWEICYFDGMPIALPLRLLIRDIHSSEVQLSWTTNAVGYRLEAAERLPATQWTPVTNTPIVAGAERVVTMHGLVRQGYFRLSKP